MSNWVLGYAVTTLHLREYAIKHGLCDETYDNLGAMTLAIDYIAAKCNLPPRQRLQALCWTGHRYGPRMVWMLSERTNTRSSKELRVSGRDLPPTTESLVMLSTILCGKQRIPFWYQRDDSWRPGQKYIRGWSKRDSKDYLEKSTYPFI
jgi:hypothetical protein